MRDGLALAAFAAAIVAAPTASAAGAERWEVTMVKGEVTANGVMMLAVGSRLTPGTSVETGGNGKIVLSRNGDTVTVFPTSKMQVPYVKGDEKPGILQSFGKLLFRMESRESRDFKVQTPYLAAATKGTTFTVSVDAGGAEVAVSEGSVLVLALGGLSAMVGAGMTATVDGDDGDTVEVSELGGDSEDEPDSGDEK